MGLSVDITKKLGAFSLHTVFESDARRIGILGPSGCGKSLTLKSIAGIERPDAGRIEVGGRVLFDRAEKIDLKPQKRQVGYMFQNYALFPSMTVAQNIGAGLRMGNAEKEARIREMVRRFRLEGLESHYPQQLSGGQQQRVALARIMAYQPDLILLDEPFSALDQHLRERLQHELLELLADYRGQVVMVSHSRDEIYRFAEELLVMDNGQILAQGKTDSLFGAPGTVAVARMTGCKNISRAVRIDAHTLRLLDWGIDLHLTQTVPADVTAVGYRAHHFEPVWSEAPEAAGVGSGMAAPANCLPCRIEGIDELPFERRYYIDVCEEADSVAAPEPVCWFVQEKERAELDRRGLPAYLRLREEDVLLLRD